jgi:hypothetical protein
MIQSSSNPSQLSGWSSTFFACVHISQMELSHGESSPLTITGGKNGVRALGSTGCSTTSSSKLAVVRFELDRKRETETSVRLRAICSEADVMLLRCLTDAYTRQSSFNTPSLDETNRSRTVQHAHAEVPQQ